MKRNGKTNIMNKPQPRTVTSTHKIHEFVHDFGEGQDKVKMMRKLKALRRDIHLEVKYEYSLAIFKASENLKNVY